MRLRTRLCPPENCDLPGASLRRPVLLLLCRLHRIVGRPARAHRAVPTLSPRTSCSCCGFMSTRQMLQSTWSKSIKSRRRGVGAKRRVDSSRAPPSSRSYILLCAARALLSSAYHLSVDVDQLVCMEPCSTPAPISRATAIAASECITMRGRSVLETRHVILCSAQPVRVHRASYGKCRLTVCTAHGQRRSFACFFCRA